MDTYQLDLTELLQDTDHPVWGRPVPITKVKNVFHCYLTGDISEPYNYNELCCVLEQATPKNKVILHINTYGGHIDSAFKIIASLKRSKATTSARLTGTVASAGTIIALSCDDLEVEDFTSFMIHNYSTGTQGKGHEIVDYINFTDKDLKRTFSQIYTGFITTREITDIIKGKDMWLSAEDTRKRWAKKKEKANG